MGSLVLNIVTQEEPSMIDRTDKLYEGYEMANNAFCNFTLMKVKNGIVQFWEQFRNGDPYKQIAETPYIKGMTAGEAMEQMKVTCS